MPRIEARLTERECDWAGPTDGGDALDRAPANFEEAAAARRSRVVLISLRIAKQNDYISNIKVVLDKYDKSIGNP